MDTLQPKPTSVTTDTTETGDRAHDEIISPLSFRDRTRTFMPQQQGAKALDQYFVGPTDTTHHSKWPFFIRVHGSVMPHMILPMLFVGLWTTCIWMLSHFLKVRLKFDSLLLTVTGFLVGLALSFRSTTGYERYMEGRKYWAQLTLTSQNLARIIWTHAKERPGEQSKEDLLAKITCLQLLVTFAIALKHRLRFEPYVEYEDLREYVEYLDTYAKSANREVDLSKRKLTKWKRVGEFLGLPFTRSNPRKEIKRAQKPLGNLPLEILGYMQAYLDTIVENGTLKTPVFSTPVVNAITTLNDILTGTDRILNTPLPLAYRIVISQITWLYVLALPFQLLGKMKWQIIPATLAAAYIILGLALIGAQIEDPFGDDVNDLPLDMFCNQIAQDIDVITSKPAAKPAEFMKGGLNKPLWPFSRSGHAVWIQRSEEQIRDALRAKVEIRHAQNKKDAQEDQEKIDVQV